MDSLSLWSLVFRNMSNISSKLCPQQFTGTIASPALSRGNTRERAAELLKNSVGWQQLMAGSHQQVNHLIEGNVWYTEEKSPTKTVIIERILILYYHAVHVPLNDGPQLMTNYSFSSSTLRDPKLSLPPPLWQLQWLPAHQNTPSGVWAALEDLCYTAHLSIAINVVSSVTNQNSCQNACCLGMPCLVVPQHQGFPSSPVKGLEIAKSTWPAGPHPPEHFLLLAGSKAAIPLSSSSIGSDWPVLEGCSLLRFRDGPESAAPPRCFRWCCERTKPQHFLWQWN